MLILDLETRSKVDLLTAGPYFYAEDPSTEIICAGFKLGKREQVWYPGTLLPLWVKQYLDGDGLVAAWNAQFDRLVWNANQTKYFIPLARWYCVAAQARVNALPGALGDATKALFGQNTKDFRGPQLIKLLSIPRADGTFNKDEKLIKEMGAYCLQDVRATADVMGETRLMTEAEHNDYLNNEQINDDGVHVDVRLATYAMRYAEAETAQLAGHLQHLTFGEVTKHTQVERIKKFLLPKLPPEAKLLTTVYKKGEKKTSLDKNIRARLLTAHEEHVIPLAPDVVDVLRVLDEGNKSSVAKFKRMVERADPEDQRVRGAFVYGGASQTLRFASRGLQLHNFARDCLTEDQTEQLKATMSDNEPLAAVMHTLSKALRPAIQAEPGNRLIVGDWSSIEARALPWLADTPSAEARLDIFRDDEDLYQITADQLRLEDRQIGKVVELSFGYGGAAGAFKAMAQNYNLYVTDAKIKTYVTRWRLQNLWAVNFWDALERAARNAIARPLEEFTAGRVTYQYIPNLIDGTLVCTLPGGHMIQYPKAKLESVETEYGPRSEITALKANWKPAAGEREWPRVRLWRGLLAENVTQAFCAALLRAAIDLCLKTDLPVIAHVHDEIVLEVAKEHAKQCRRELQQIMEENPPWAENLPLKAEPTIMRRYGK